MVRSPELGFKPWQSGWRTCLLSHSSLLPPKLWGRGWRWRVAGEVKSKYFYKWMPPLTLSLIAVFRITTAPGGLAAYTESTAT